MWGLSLLWWDGEDLVCENQYSKYPSLLLLSGFIQGVCGDFCLKILWQTVLFSYKFADLEQNCSDNFFVIGICADIFSPNTSVCVPFWGREARETGIQMHSWSLLLLPTSVAFVVQNKGFEGPYELCEVPLQLPGSPWRITILLIIWVGGPNLPLCGTSGLLVKKAESPLFPWYLLLCLAVYFLPILLMLVFVQTHGETD